MTSFPNTSLPVWRFLVRINVSMGVMIFKFVGVVYTEQGTGESGDLSESYQERFVQLSERVKIHSAKEHDQASDGEHRSGDELDNIFGQFLHVF